MDVKKLSTEVLSRSLSVRNFFLEKGQFEIPFTRFSFFLQVTSVKACSLSVLPMSSTERSLTSFVAQAEGGGDDEMQVASFGLSSLSCKVETLVREGQALLHLGYGDVEKLSDEEVLKWTAASLREDDVRAETILKAVQAMRDQEVDGAALVSEVSYNRLVSHPYNLPGGPAAKLASRIQSLQAKKAGKGSIERKLAAFSKKVLSTIFWKHSSSQKLKRKHSSWSFCEAEKQVVTAEHFADAWQVPQIQLAQGQSLVGMEPSIKACMKLVKKYIYKTDKEDSSNPHFDDNLMTTWLVIQFPERKKKENHFSLKAERAGTLRRQVPAVFFESATSRAG